MGTSSGFFSMGYGSPAATRHISISFSQEPAVHQGDQIFGLHLGFLPLLVRIGARGSGWRRRPLGRSLCLTAGSFLPGSSLCALGRRRLHPPSVQGLHSHTLGGYAGGEQRRRALTRNLRRGSRSNSGWTLGWI
jgi:hypothetical protein